MIDICTDLHQCFNQLPRHSYPFDIAQIPKNGIYALFENGEKGHDTDRIVRIGTHTGQDKLRSRIEEHYIKENHNRSIFRKNIGRAFLNKENDPFLEQWEIDLTTRDARERFSHLVDREKLQKVENQVTEYMRSHFSFVVFEVPNKDDRLLFESRLISTVCRCPTCKPSVNWLGLYSPKQKIRESGLWLVNELNNQPLSLSEWEELKKLIEFTK